MDVNLYKKIEGLSRVLLNYLRSVQHYNLIFSTAGYDDNLAFWEARKMDDLIKEIRSTKIDIIVDLQDRADKGLQPTQIEMDLIGTLQECYLARYDGPLHRDYKGDESNTTLWCCKGYVADVEINIETLLTAIGGIFPNIVSNPKNGPKEADFEGLTNPSALSSNNDVSQLTPKDYAAMLPGCRDEEILETEIMAAIRQGRLKGWHWTGDLKELAIWLHDEILPDNNKDDTNTKWSLVDNKFTFCPGKGRSSDVRTATARKLRQAYYKCNLPPKK